MGRILSIAALSRTLLGWLIEKHGISIGRQKLLDQSLESPWDDRLLIQQ
jgi:hypothetical protein